MPLFSIVAAFFGILAIVFCFLQGVVLTGNVLGSTGSYTEFQLIFGDSGSLNVCVGLVFAFCFVILALLGSICEAYIAYKGAKKNQKMILVLGGVLNLALFVTAAILFFCTIKLSGFDGDTYGLVTVKAGAAVYLAGIFSILAGILDVPCALLPVLK